MNTVADLRLRAAVITGPVLAADDPVYRDVAIPVAFWKVVATVDETGAMHATSYVLSQDELLDDLETQVDETGPVFGPYRMFQVPVTEVEAATRLDLGPLRDADPLGGEEPSDRRPEGDGERRSRREVRSFADVVLR